MKKLPATVAILASLTILLFFGVLQREHPESFEIPFVTLLPQPDHITCGPTSAAMVLLHFGKKVTVKDVEGKTRTAWFRYNGNDVGMTSPDMVASAMRHFGVPSSVKWGRLDTLKHSVSLGAPCVVLIRSGDTTWHYVVVRGFTPEKVLIADPGGGILTEMTTAVFEGCWNWSADMDGIRCSDTLPALLRAAEIYPNTYICPDLE